MSLSLGCDVNRKYFFFVYTFLLDEILVLYTYSISSIARTKEQVTKRYDNWYGLSLKLTFACFNSVNYFFIFCAVVIVVFFYRNTDINKNVPFLLVKLPFWLSLMLLIA